ncbi:hypothetical protein L7F22_033430 [Adiantum nelumboides]|nr:hypothetical protein [Adiantum nelumboides]
MFSPSSPSAALLINPFKPKAPPTPEPLWKYVIENETFAKGGSKKWSCSFCKDSHTCSYPRVRAHLLGIKGLGVAVCCKVTAEDRANMTREDHESATKKQKANPSHVRAANKLSTQPSVEGMFKYTSRESVYEAVARCFYDCGMPFVIARSPYFHDMVNAVSSFGKGYKAPNYEKLRTTLVESEVAKVSSCLTGIKEVCEGIVACPCMGVVYEGIDQMLEQIKEVLKEEVDGASMYEEISLLAQERWEMLHSPIHATAFVLNPQLFSKKPHKDKDVMKGWRMTLDRVGKSMIEKTEFKAELSQYIGLQRDFAEVSALEDMQKLSPVAWWENYGTCTPKLQRLAIRVLSQVSSASACERNSSTYGFIHSLNRNRLGHKKADDLVYVHSNLRLLSRKEPSYASGPCKAWDVLEDDSFEECFEDVNLDDDIAPM